MEGAASTSNKLTYEQAMHAMQSGVAVEMNKNSSPTEPKHLRVGINSCLIDSAALVRLLVKKGVFTHEEFEQELEDEANREVERYERRLSALYGGGNITLR